MVFMVFSALDLENLARILRSLDKVDPNVTVAQIEYEGRNYTVDRKGYKGQRDEVSYSYRIQIP